MIIVVSPAKSLDMLVRHGERCAGEPKMIEASKDLVEILARKDACELSELMSISMNLADLNAARWRSFRFPFDQTNARSAIFAFRGDVYKGLDADSFSDADLDFAQDHFRMLSGLYGLLRPLDLIQPYRLEMGTKLKTAFGGNLYDFWGERITDLLNVELAAQGGILVNLASNEYFSSIVKRRLAGEIVTPVFKEKRGDGYKIVSIFAKRARGLMSRFIIQNRISRVKDLHEFDHDGYSFFPSLSEERMPVFVRASKN